MQTSSAQPEQLKPTLDTASHATTSWDSPQVSGAGSTLQIDERDPSHPPSRRRHGVVLAGAERASDATAALARPGRRGSSRPEEDTREKPTAQARSPGRGSRAPGGSPTRQGRPLSPLLSDSALDVPAKTTRRENQQASRVGSRSWNCLLAADVAAHGSTSEGSAGAGCGEQG